MKIGSNIAALRKEKGFTQEKLANELGVSAQAVSKWENDSSCPDIALLPEIAAIFGVTVDDLLRCGEEDILKCSSGKTTNENSGYSSSVNYAKKVIVRIIQQNGKENTFRIPFKLVKTGISIASTFGLESTIAEKISEVLCSEEIGDVFDMDTENGEHIQISLI